MIDSEHKLTWHCLSTKPLSTVDPALSLQHSNITSSGERRRATRHSPSFADMSKDTRLGGGQGLPLQNCWQIWDNKHYHNATLHPYKIVKAWNFRGHFSYWYWTGYGQLSDKMALEIVPILSLPPSLSLYDSNIKVDVKEEDELNKRPFHSPCRSDGWM